MSLLNTVKVSKYFFKPAFVMLAFFELIIFYLSPYLSILIVVKDVDLNLFSNIALFSAYYALTMSLLMIAMGNYQSEKYNRKKDFIFTWKYAFISILLAIFLGLSLFLIWPGIYPSNDVTLLSLLISILSIITLRTAFFRFLNHDEIKRRVLVFGAGKSAKKLIEKYQQSNQDTSFKIIGYIPLYPEEKEVSNNNIIHVPTECLFQYVKDNYIEEIIVAIDDRREHFPADELMKCRMYGVNIIEPVTFIEREKGKVNLQLLTPSWFIYSDTHKDSLVEKMTKRGFDLIFSLLILIILSPILILVCCLIWLESGGKGCVFYHQYRVGLGGKIFKLHKFRSMCLDAEENGKAVWAKVNDQRVTWIGKLIRRTRIDELPQIINILNGDMSLVGPRPERPEFVDELAKDIKFYHHRHSVKPGLAGWAQLKYSYGSCKKDAVEKLQYDLFYVKNKSVLMDIMILLQTIEIVILGRGYH